MNFIELVFTAFSGSGSNSFSSKKSNHHDLPQKLYLPEYVEGKQVLKYLENDKRGHKFRVDKSKLNPDCRLECLEYRLNKDLGDLANIHAAWGSKVRGKLGDGWLEVVS